MPWMMQGVLFSAIRSCDGPFSQDPCKKVVRAVRALVLKTAQTTGSFGARHPKTNDLCDALTDLIKHHDDYPVHFYIHLVHAIEVIGYMCPQPIMEETSGVVWEEVYLEAVAAMHMTPETRDEMMERLVDNPRVHVNEKGFNEMDDRLDLEVKP